MSKGNWITCIIALAGLFMAECSLSANPTTTPQPTTNLSNSTTINIETPHNQNPLTPSENGASPCRIEFGYRFYPKVIVQQVLGNYKINSSTITNIVKTLVAKDTSVHDVVYQRAQKITPNIFTKGDKKEVRALYRTVVLEIFTNTLQSNGIKDKTQINTMFDDIQYIRMTKFAQCEGYTNRIKVQRGFMPIVRNSTIEETISDFPEAYNPKVRQAIIEKLRQQKANTSNPNQGTINGASSAQPSTNP